MIDWHGRVFVEAGRVPGWDFMFGIVFEKARYTSRYQPSVVHVRLFIWWIEFTYKSSAELRDSALLRRKP